MLNNLQNGANGSFPSEVIQKGLDVLAEALSLSIDANCDRWLFAVTIQELERFGLRDRHFRWLVEKNYVQHGREVTIAGDDGREFRSTGNLTFTPKTCFVLTDEGIDAHLKCSSHFHQHNSVKALRTLVQAKSAVVYWDPEIRVLRLNGEVVKRFKWPAANQEAVLCAFQEEGWPSRIDDPLPPQPEQDTKRRLSDTIKCLNRKQANALMHFRGDGTGEGVVWEVVTASSNSNDAELTPLNPGRMTCDD